MHSLNRTIPEVPPLTNLPSSNCKIKRLIFCRHAETDPNANFQLQGSGIDEHLNNKGVQQAEALAKRLASHPNIGVIITSHLKRAIQTSEIIANSYPKKLEILKESKLAEISWGIWEGMVCPDLKSLIETWISGDFTARAPGGESPLEVRDRVLPVIYSLLNRPEENILIVVHGRLLRILLSSILYGDLYHMQLFNHRNTCVNIIDVLYEPVILSGIPTSLKQVTSIKQNKGHTRTKSPLIRSLSGGGIIISPIPVNSASMTTENTNHHQKQHHRRHHSHQHHSTTTTTTTTTSSNNRALPTHQNFILNKKLTNSGLFINSQNSINSINSVNSIGSLGSIGLNISIGSINSATAATAAETIANPTTTPSFIPTTDTVETSSVHSYSSTSSASSSSAALNNMNNINNNNMNNSNNNNNTLNNNNNNNNMYINSFNNTSHGKGTMNDDNDEDDENDPEKVETPIFDIELNPGQKYKVKFIAKLLDSEEHLTADLF